MRFPHSRITGRNAVMRVVTGTTEMGNDKRAALLQGSLDLLILQSLVREARHGYAIAKHLKDVSEDYLQVEEGSLYPALHRLERRGWICSFWGASDANRRAKFYQLTPEGKRQLKIESEGWKKMATAINRVLGLT